MVKREIYNHISKEQYRNIAMHIAIFLFYVLSFRMIVDSGLSADDMWNSNIQAASYLNGPSAFEVTWNQLIVWLRLGRVFPFSNYATLLFTLVPSVTAYKSCIVGMVYLNNLICGFCVKRISKSVNLQFLSMLLFPVLIQMTPEFDSGLYCYHMLIQMVVLWCFLSLWFLLRYMEAQKKSYVVGSAFCLFLALGTYEVAFTFILVLLWVVWMEKRDYKKTFWICLPNLLVFLTMGLANVCARLFLQESTYQGTAVNLSIQAVLLTFLKQCSTCFPLGRYICSAIKYCEPYSDVYPYSLQELWGQLQILDIVVILLFLGAIFWLIKHIEILSGVKAIIKEKDIKTVPRDGNITLIGLGLLVFLLPGILIAISTKYQQLLGWCSGHLPAYMQSIGLGIFVTGLFAWLMACIQNMRMKQVVSWTCVGVAVVVILLNQISGRAAVGYMNGYRRYPQENITAAAEVGLFDDISNQEDQVLFGTTAYIYDSSNPYEFYSKLTASYVNAIPRGELINRCIQTFGSQSSYDLLSLEEQQYYGVFNQAKREGGALIIGRCVKVELNEAETDFSHVWIEQPQVFLRGETDVELSEEWRVIETGDNYQIYESSGIYDIMQEESYYRNEAGEGVLYR